MFTIPLYDDNPSERTPFFTWAIIAACVVVFLWQVGLGPRGERAVAYSLGLVPAVLFGYAELPPQLQLVPSGATLITHMFLHGGWTHLLGNMLFLWIFGNNIEDALGHGRYLLFYLLCGLAAATAQIVTDPASEIPMVGASGAIAGVLGAYLILHPHANVRVLVWIIVFVRLVNIPAWIVLGFWFAAQLFGGLATPMAKGGVAFWAHVGGFVAGVVLIVVLRPRRVALLQPQRTEPFATAPMRAIGEGGEYGRYGRGSVPDAGFSRRRGRGPWD
jgi:membrane associated rhomboid family serine protease